MQNTSHAVMAQRSEPLDSLDHFPTPPWAVRVLMEHVISPRHAVQDKTCLEPACGEGYTARTLDEYFDQVKSSDVYPYGYGAVRDYVATSDRFKSVDWVITNPPFRLAEGFILKSLDVCREGVAMLTRTTFLESVGRYDRLFSTHPPSIFAQFVERVPMVKGRLG